MPQGLSRGLPRRGPLGCPAVVLWVSRGSVYALIVT